MIEQCKQYITCRGKETLWLQDRDDVRNKLLHCIRLNRVYHNTYTLVKRQPFLPNQTPFSFSENYVFGKFDAFCDRLGKIISVFDLLDDYNGLFERRMEGNFLVTICFPKIIPKLGKQSSNLFTDIAMFLFLHLRTCRKE